MRKQEGQKHCLQKFATAVASNSDKIEKRDLVFGKDAVLFSGKLRKHRKLLRVAYERNFSESKH